MQQRLPLRLLTPAATLDASLRTSFCTSWQAYAGLSLERIAGCNRQHPWRLAASLLDTFRQPGLDSMLCVSAYVDPLSLPDIRISSEPRPFSPSLPLCNTGSLVSYTAWHRLGLATGLQHPILYSCNHHSRTPSQAHRKRSPNLDNYCHAPSAASEK